MGYKAVVFDFDYTLGDCTTGIEECVNYALNRMNYPAASLEKIRKSVGMTLEQTFFFLTDGSAQSLGLTFKNLFMEKADDVMAQSAVFLPYAREVVEQLLKDQIKVGIVTTKYRYRIVSIFELLGVPHLIEDIIGGDNVRKEKPDPEGLNRMIEGWKLHKDEVLYVGDSMVDAMTAKNAGVDFAAVTTGATSFEDFNETEYKMIMEDLRPVITLVRG